MKIKLFQCYILDWNEINSFKLLSAGQQRAVELIQTYSSDDGGSEDDRVCPIPRVAVFVSGDGHTLARSL